MSESLANPFAKVCGVGSDTGTVNLELMGGGGQMFTTPMSVALKGALLTPIVGNYNVFSLGLASALKGQMLSIHSGAQIVNPGPPCKVSVSYVLRSSSGTVFFDGVVELTATLNSIVSIGGMILFQ